MDLRFIVFPRRSKSGNDVGRLVDPQALGGNMDDLRGECSTLYHWLTNSDAPQDIMQVSDGLSTEIDRSHSIDVSYLDDDSDFEDEDDCEEIMNPFTVDRKVRALLNKLTDTQFVPISNQLIAWANKSEIESDGRTLIHIIRLVFEKAMNEPMYTGLYARLCRTMMEQISPGVQDEQIRDAAGAPIPGGHLFRKCLLIRCQGDFERGFETRDTGKIDLFSSTYYAAKQRGLGLIKFIGELFKLQMLTERIMHECIKKLLGNVEDPDERDLESLCMLLTTVGQLIDTPQARPHMDVYFDRMQGLCTNPNVTLRMQFVLEDVIALRERKWVPSERPSPLMSFLGLRDTTKVSPPSLGRNAAAIQTHQTTRNTHKSSGNLHYTAWRRAAAPSTPKSPPDPPAASGSHMKDPARQPPRNSDSEAPSPSLDVFVKGAAGPTWHAFVYYLCHGTIVFAPLRSEGEVLRRAFIEDYCTRNPHLPPPCSSKSIYRLAVMLNVPKLKALALGDLASRLNASNVVDEYFTAFTHRYPEITQLEESILRKHQSDIIANMQSLAAKGYLTGSPEPHSLSKHIGEMIVTWTPERAPKNSQHFLRPTLGKLFLCCAMYALCIRYYLYLPPTQRTELIRKWLPVDSFTHTNES